jgi:hypothetical protein
LSAVVQIKSHLRKGKTVKAHTRTYGGLSAKNYLHSVRGGEFHARKKGMSAAQHLMTPEQIQKSMENGFHAHSSGNVIYYDKERKDHYITPGIHNVAKYGGKSVSERDSDGTNRIYFKKNHRQTISKFLNAKN